MSNYTPTTEEVRTRYWLNDGEPSDPTEGEEFDRWLAAHDAEVWDEGATAAAYSVSATHHYAKNPYRE